MTGGSDGIIHIMLAHVHMAASAIAVKDMDATYEHLRLVEDTARKMADVLDHEKQHKETESA